MTASRSSIHINYHFFPAGFSIKQNEHFFKLFCFGPFFALLMSAKKIACAAEIQINIFGQIKAVFSGPRDSLPPAFKPPPIGSCKYFQTFGRFPCDFRHFKADMCSFTTRKLRLAFGCLRFAQRFTSLQMLCLFIHFHTSFSTGEDCGVICLLLILVFYFCARALD